jgi:hypothetical protein
MSENGMITFHIHTLMTVEKFSRFRSEWKTSNLDQIIIFFITDSTGRVAFANYDIPERSKELPEHIKGTSHYYEEDKRYFVIVEDQPRGVEFINGNWYFIHWSHRKECWTVNPSQDHINDPRIYQLGTKALPWG